MFFHRSTVASSAGPIEIGFTDSSLDLRADGPSFPAQFSSLEEACGVRLARMDQVHGNDVVVVDQAVPGSDAGAPTADALVTTGRGLGLLTRVADCVPVLLLDAEQGVVAAVHSGRPGTVLDVVGATVRRMHDLGATTLAAWVGPSVCGGCYEVPEQMREDVNAAAPGTWAETRWGTPSVDVAAGVRAQLDAAGVSEVRVVPGCTREDPALHSYRRDGAAAGRFAGVVWMP